MQNNAPVTPEQFRIACLLAIRDISDIIRDNVLRDQSISSRYFAINAGACFFLKLWSEHNSELANALSETDLFERLGADDNSLADMLACSACDAAEDALDLFAKQSIDTPERISADMLARLTAQVETNEG